MTHWYSLVRLYPPNRPYEDLTGEFAQITQQELAPKKTIARATLGIVKRSKLRVFKCTSCRPSWMLKVWDLSCAPSIPCVAILSGALEFAWNALCWLLRKRKWPKDDASLGVLSCVMLCVLLLPWLRASRFGVVRHFAKNTSAADSVADMPRGPQDPLRNWNNQQESAIPLYGLFKNRSSGGPLKVPTPQLWG